MDEPTANPTPVPGPIADVVVSRVTVSDFRGVEAADLHLGPNATFLVGENNSGKTSLLQAIAVAFGKRQATRDDLRRSGSTTADAAYIDVFLTPKSGTTFDDQTRQRIQTVQRLPSGARSEVAVFRTKLSTGNEGQQLTEVRSYLQPAGEGWVESPARFAPGVLQLVDVHLLEASRDLLSELGNRSSTWGRVVADLQVPDLDSLPDGTAHPGGRAGLEQELAIFAQRLRDASPVLQQLAGDLSRLSQAQTTLGDVALRALPPRIEDLARAVEVVMTQRDNTSLPLRFHGLGSRSLAALLVFQTMCALRVGVDRGLRPRLVTLLEEPEAHLHPQAIVAMRQVIKHLDGQALVTTHSPQLVAEVHPEDVRLLRRTSSGTKIKRLSVSTAKRLAQFRRFVERPLGEIFFARLVVFGDGTSERNTLPAVLEPLLGGPPAGLGITFVDCESMDDPKLAKVVEALQMLEIPWLLFADNDPSGQKALAQIKDQNTGAAIDFDHPNVVRSGSKQIEQMLIDAGYLSEIDKLAREVGQATADEKQALAFLTSHKAWAVESTAQAAMAAGRAPPQPVEDLAQAIRNVLWIRRTGRWGMTASSIRDKSLTPDQEFAVNLESKRILLVASAGSGKTEVLTRRLARILSESAGDSFRCLAVTYTVRAAQELRTRIQATTASEYWRADANTLHGFALDWLKQYGQDVGIGPDVVVYAEDADRARLIYEYLASLGLQEAVGPDELQAIRPILGQIDSHRTNHPGEKCVSDDREYFSVPMDELYEGYLEALDRVGGIDFPGMLAKFLELLDVDPWVGENFRSLFRHILVDEAQDLTMAQASLLVRLAGDALYLFAVADDRQSINGFAGGSFENAQLLVGPEAAAQPLVLPHNFRSAAGVLQAAERLAKSFRSRTLEATVLTTSPPGRVRVLECPDPVAEARAVAEWAAELLESGLAVDAVANGEDRLVQPESIAVIGRARWVLDPVIASLEEAGIRFALDFERGGFLSTPEARILLDALFHEANSADTPARRRIVGELRQLGVEARPDHVEAMKTSDLPSLLAVSTLTEMVRAGRPLEEVFEELDRIVSPEWSKDASELSTLWANYRASTQAKFRNLQGFLRFVSSSQRVRPSDPGVRVTTIHKVKGLEFRAVAVVSVREGTLPDYRALTEEAVDAERRSLYVAMTRAARDLLITWPGTSFDRYGRQHAQSPSRFLDEAGLLASRET